MRMVSSVLRLAGSRWGGVVVALRLVSSMDGAPGAGAGAVDAGWRAVQARLALRRRRYIPPASAGTISHASIGSGTGTKVRASMVKRVAA